MLLVDDIHEHSADHRLTLLGLYSAIGVPFFPWNQDVLLVYVALQGVVGVVPLTFRIATDAEQGAVLFETREDVRFSHADALVEHVFVATNVTFAEAGYYRVQLWSEDRLLQQRRLLVWRSATNGRSRQSKGVKP
jgi:hypothetical protein